MWWSQKWGKGVPKCTLFPRLCDIFHVWSHLEKTHGLSSNILSKNVFHPTTDILQFHCYEHGNIKFTKFDVGKKHMIQSHCRPHGKVVFSEAEASPGGRPPLRRQTPPPETDPPGGRPSGYWHLVAATAVVGTHPTGMHSCCKWFCDCTFCRRSFVAVWCAPFFKWLHAHTHLQVGNG